MEVTPMTLSMADLMPAGAEILVAAAACMLLLADVLGASRVRGLTFFLAIAALALRLLGLLRELPEPACHGARMK